MSTPPMTDTQQPSFLRIVHEEFAKQKAIGEGALAQLHPDDLHWTPDSESNSVYILVKHLAGNMQSRWTDFLTTDGEKPDRHRDREFMPDPADRAAVLDIWETGWGHVFRTLSTLTEEDLAHTVHIRGEPYTAMAAIARQLTHYAYHVGQIVYVARQRLGPGWQSLSIPRGKSAEYLRRPRPGVR